MVIHPPDGSDHRPATGERQRKIGRDPAHYAGDDNSTEDRDDDRETSSSRRWNRMLASLVGNVHQFVERVQSYAARKEPAQQRRGSDEDRAKQYHVG